MDVVDRRSVVRAPRAWVWRHLTESDRLAGWLMRNDFAPEVGRRFRFEGRPQGGWDGRVECRVDALEPARVVAYSWEANDIGVPTRVRFELVDVEGGTELILRHDGFGAVSGSARRIVEAHDRGWRDHLAVLVRQVEESWAGT